MMYVSLFLGSCACCVRVTAKGVDRLPPPGVSGLDIECPLFRSPRNIDADPQSLHAGDEIAKPEALRDLCRVEGKIACRIDSPPRSDETEQVPATIAVPHDLALGHEGVLALVAHGRDSPHIDERERIEQLELSGPIRGVNYFYTCPTKQTYDKDKKWRFRDN